MEQYPPVPREEEHVGLVLDRTQPRCDGTMPVQSRTSDSPAAEAGLKPGDVIQEINHHAVKNADEAVQLTTKTTSKKTLVRVWENGGSHYVVVDESTKAG